MQREIYFLTLQIILFLSPTIPMEVEKIIDGLDMKKVSGPYNIPNIILKSFKLFFSAWLSRLINLCFKVGVFPDIEGCQDHSIA